MAASNSGGGPISTQAAAALAEGINLVFGRWTALQMAVENQWGGRDSRAKADQFGESLHSWFCRSRGTYSSFSILGLFTPLEASSGSLGAQSSNLSQLKFSYLGRSIWNWDRL